MKGPDMPMTEAEERRYNAMYAADMKVIAAHETCEAAGVELIHSGNGMWRWRRGPDHSYDAGKGSGFFYSKDEAAMDFTQSESFRVWLRSRGVRV
jgi:hypothetical protein